MHFTNKPDVELAPHSRIVFEFETLVTYFAFLGAITAVFVLNKLHEHKKIQKDHGIRKNRFFIFVSIRNVSKNIHQI